MAWELKDRQIDSVTLVDVVGRLETSGGSDALEEKLQSLIRQGQRSLLLECSRVSAIDSSGIGALVRCVISVHNRGGDLKLLRLSPVMRSALKVLGLIERLESFDDEATALASFK
jgi:anti-sigma B factor antagonist